MGQKGQTAGLHPNGRFPPPNPAHGLSIWRTKAKCQLLSQDFNCTRVVLFLCLFFTQKCLHTVSHFCPADCKQSARQLNLHWYYLCPLCIVKMTISSLGCRSAAGRLSKKLGKLVTQSVKIQSKTSVVFKMVASCVYAFWIKTYCKFRVYVSNYGMSFSCNHVQKSILISYFSAVLNAWVF